MNLPLEHITLLYAEGNYTFYYTIDSKKFAKKRSLSKIMEELDTYLIRVHKNYAINPAHVSQVQPKTRIINIGKSQIPFSRHYQDSLQTLIHSLQ